MPLTAVPRYVRWRNGFLRAAPPCDSAAFPVRAVRCSPPGSPVISAPAASSPSSPRHPPTPNGGSPTCSTSPARASRSTRSAKRWAKTSRISRSPASASRRSRRCCVANCDSWSRPRAPAPNAPPCRRRSSRCGSSSRSATIARSVRLSVRSSGWAIRASRPWRKSRSSRSAVASSTCTGLAWRRPHASSGGVTPSVPFARSTSPASGPARNFPMSPSCPSAVRRSMQRPSPAAPSNAGLCSSCFPATR